MSTAIVVPLTFFVEAFAVGVVVGISATLYLTYKFSSKGSK